jgi:hypothetical protein
MNAGHFEQISDCWLLEEQPATYYRSAAARARMLQADATTPRMRQYLDKMIVHCERLAGQIEQPASRPLDRPGCVDQRRGKIRPSARAISDYRVDPINGLRPAIRQSVSNPPSPRQNSRDLRSRPMRYSNLLTSR